MLFRYTLITLLLLSTISPVYGEEQDSYEEEAAQEIPSIPEPVYTGLDHILSLFQSEAELNQDQLEKLVDFVWKTPAESSFVLNRRQSAAGAFHSFTIDTDIFHLLEYAYNPSIPAYVAMPSTVQKHEWLTPEVIHTLEKLPHVLETSEDVLLLRGRERESITPDSNTGGYYKYTQDRIMASFPGPRGPVVISATSQTDASEVGRKGCVVGDDENWNYLYSGKKGINKTGLGWVDSYMYFAYSVVVYVADTETDMVHVGSFKWLNAGWAKINMVNSDHILAGIKRFAGAFKTILESPGLPKRQQIEDKYVELKQISRNKLRQKVTRYLQALDESDDLQTCPSSFAKTVSSGEYLKRMSREEMVRILLLEYVKGNIAKSS